ncbi:MAG: hypothetical protein C4555_06490 [Dehalococcoidia bacterium]|jgi:preprotein translocase subunit Sec61beta|nr:MAG: hypothetical protein C4555_06490 [Dehalococcoidia bacterium]
MINKKRIIGAALSLVGFVVGWAGYGMWRSPELDWNGFKNSGTEVLRWFGSEIIRLAGDPFAVIGIVVMVGGVLVLIKGILIVSQRSGR